ncbi:MAG TPA: enoyl-CoA hydratase/isomerase family protein [Steroidobacteraceae bacterium]|jgi:enoyl-CoA hydratase/carnithine racemase|nr:enoyl-CoA hydratase/isomerase family protein [Steroidobacteraceae bacterium]
MLDVTESPANDGSPEAGRIRIIKLSRPPVNALNGEMLRKITAAVESAANEAAIVIAGHEGLFSGGLDVLALLALDREAVTSVFVDLWRAQRAIATSRTPIVFALTGHSPAGGTVLAIHGDYRVMAQGAFRLGLNEVQVGLFPGSVIHGAFKRLVGGHAAQLLTRGALIDPAAALRVGLVDELCDASQVLARAIEVAREFCALPREPMLRTRALVRGDLIALFGNPGHALMQEREFAAMAAEMWFVPATQQRLQSMFRKK